MPTMVQPVPSDVIESLRAEAMAEAEQALVTKQAECEKQAHLARVRVAELEQRLRRAEADGDEMSVKLTLAEVQKAEAERGREIAERQLARMSEGAFVSQRVLDLEAELGQLRSGQEEMDSLKKTVMVLAKELKKRMKAEGNTGSMDDKVAEPTGLDWLEAVPSSSEDTDYVTDSRSGSDTE